MKTPQTTCQPKSTTPKRGRPIGSKNTPKPAPAKSKVSAKPSALKKEELQALVAKLEGKIARLTAANKALKAAAKETAPTMEPAVTKRVARTRKPAAAALAIPNGVDAAHSAEV